jgi:hypothetical protein
LQPTPTRSVLFKSGLPYIILGVLFLVMFHLEGE